MSIGEGYGNASQLQEQVAYLQSELTSALRENEELKNLLLNRPALNAGLVEAYHEWTAEVYRAMSCKKIPEGVMI